MRKALTYVLVIAAAGGLSSAPERKSWNKIRYIGGTLAIKSSSYDWDTTISISSKPDTVELVVAPSSAFGRQQMVSLKPAQITSVVNGPGAWQRVADVPGAQLPPKPHGLFGLLNRSPVIIGKPDAFLAILYQGDDGKLAAILLGCQAGTHTDVSLGRSLAALSGKPLVYAK
jgi:hypothetical protein